VLHAAGRIHEPDPAPNRGDRIPTGPGRSDLDQAAAVRGFLTAAHRYRGTYNVTDFRWFNLRDNNSSGPGFQQQYGLLRDDYSAKPAFGAYRRLIALHGARRR
jgi:hypothetical protein